MAQPLFNWKRFWHPRSSSLNLMDGGYLPDPDSRLGHLANPDVEPFEKICNAKCLVLLGEPGMGKSTVHHEQQQALERESSSNGDQYLFFNLRSFQSDTRLAAEVFQSLRFQEWLNGTYNLHLFLDSLDEGLLSINVLVPFLLDEFKKLPTDRLYLRITSRAAEWPTLLENGLIEQWGKEVVKFGVLAPLRQKDVAEAASVSGIMSDSFLKEIEDKSVVPFAIKPVTLKFLLSTYKQHGSFPKSQAELYLTGCRSLAQENSKSRITAEQTGQLTPNQRLTVAGRIAAITVLANRNTVFTGTNSYDASDEDVTIADLSGGSESSDSTEFAVGEREINETIRSGLFSFSAQGENRVGWAHQTYAEYLAAWYVAAHKLQASQI
ncbi:MAG: NACHT domain-containing protein, partial [Nitrospiraceae bacterium]